LGFKYMKKISILVAVVIIVAVAVLLMFRSNKGGKIEEIQRVVQTEEVGEGRDEQIVVNMQGHWKGEDLREDFVLETIKEFETRNPGVKVNLQWNADFNDGRAGALQATVDQIKSGEINWDVIWLEPFYYQEIANALGDQDWAKNNLVDFETIPTFKESQKDFILSDPQFRSHMNNVITGPYIEGFYQPFFYNRELTDMMGIEVKDKNMTFDDLLGYFKAVDEYNKANGTDIAILYDSGDYAGGIGYAPSVWNIFQSLFRSEFSDLTDIKDKNFSSAKMAAIRKALDSLEQLSQYQPLIKGWEDLSWFETRDYVLDNKAVFTVCGASWMYSHWHGLDAAKTMKMVPVEMPVYQSVNHYIGGYNPMFAVMEKSLVREEAVGLLMSFSEPNVAEKWVRYAKGPSGIKGNVSQAGGVSKEEDQFDKFITYITNKYGGNIFDSKTVDYVLGEKYKGLSLRFNKYLAAVIEGELSAEAAYMAIEADLRAVDRGEVR